MFREINTNFEDFATFTQIFAGNSERQQFLKVAHINLVGLEGLEDELEFDQDPTEAYAPDPNLDAYGKRVSFAIKDVWEELHSWGNDLSIDRFYLYFPPHPATEVSYSDDWSSLLVRVPYIHILDSYTQGYRLPELSAIRELYLNSEESRVSPASMMSLVATMPDLDEIEVGLDDKEKKVISWRKEIRAGKPGDILPILGPNF